MQTMRMLILLAVAVLAPWGANGASHTKVELFLSASSAQPGETVLAGLRMTMDEHWHTYWRNPGEAGKSTEITWNLPPGVTAGTIQWPVPEKYDWLGLFNYVYHDEATLLIPLTLGPDVSTGTATIQAQVDWLECEEQCVPGRGSVSATLTVGPESTPSPQVDLIEQAASKLPKKFPGDSASAWWGGEPENENRPLLVAWAKQSQGSQFDFFPFESENYVVQTKTENVPDDAGRVRLRKIVEKYDGDWPDEQGGLLIEQDKDGEILAAYSVNLPIASSAEASAPVGAADSVAVSSTVGTSGEVGGGGPDPSLWVMLGLAFLGGLILNVMPCVLPVISLKILGFVNQSREEPGRVRRMGVIYALGVVASFLVLAGLVIGVQQAGKVASWGMQFGNPVFLVAITVLVVMVALNLFGLFEVNLGGSAMGAAGTLAAKEGPLGAFFNGILATMLATPCTAPFLSVALGFAFTKPPSIILLTFVTVALGLAFPYVLLSWQPGWLKFLPKPGPWMQRFKVAMGFPMLATGVWLFSILSRHYGQSGILWVGWFIVVVAVAAWIWGEFVQRGRRHRGVAMAVSILWLVTGYIVILEGQLHWRQPSALTAATGTLPPRDPNGIQWQAWSEEAVAEARSQGRPVFVDFTADWCATCKYNERNSIKIPSVTQKLKEIDAVALLADHTLLPENITLELRKFKRAGVPMVLVYPRDTSLPPRVLPTLLTPGIVLDALEWAGQEPASAGTKDPPSS